MKKLMQMLRANASTERQAIKVEQNDPMNATIYLYDVIDAYFGIGAKEVATAIAGLDKATTLHLRINSPGGDVFEARAIAAAIAGHPGKTVAHIDGLAASAATFIAAQADEVEISEGAFYMIHNGWTMALGDKRAMGETAALLAKVDDSIIKSYNKRTGAGEDQLAAWMDAETWFTAEEAVENKFADRLSATAKDGDGSASNHGLRHFNLGAYEKTPQALMDTEKSKQQETVDATAWLVHNERRLQLLDLNA